MIKRLFLLIICVLLAVSLYYFTIYQSTINGFNSDEKINLSVEYGTSVKKYVKLLKTNNIIKEEWPMLVYLRFYDKANNLQAGNFVITKGTSIPKLVNILANAKSEELVIRILEGSTIEDIDQILTQANLTKPNEFTDCTKNCDFTNFSFIHNNDLEGYLFPDTYFVDANKFTTKSFIDRLLTRFKEQILTPDNITTYQSQNRLLKDMVIMASMIEKEERDNENRPIVAGILWKRLDEKIHLGVDATTRYYNKNKQGALTKADFDQDNAYNTRKHLGLPPTAIGNFGFTAWQATLFPQVSSYYYYLHDNNGKIHYATTNDEHNQNKYKYLR